MVASASRSSNSSRMCSSNTAAAPAAYSRAAAATPSARATAPASSSASSSILHAASRVRARVTESSTRFLLVVMDHAADPVLGLHQLEAAVELVQGQAMRHEG